VSIVTIVYLACGPMWFCYSNYAQGCQFKVGQLIFFRYTFVQATGSTPQ